MEEFRLDDSSQFNLIRNNGLMENNEHVVWFYNEFLSRGLIFISRFRVCSFRIYICRDKGNSEGERQSVAQNSNPFLEIDVGETRKLLPLRPRWISDSPRDNRIKVQVFSFFLFFPTWCLSLREIYDYDTNIHSYIPLIIDRVKSRRRTPRFVRNRLFLFVHSIFSNLFRD